MGKYPYQSGILFLLALSLHIYYNWALIVKYLKDRTKKLKVFTADFNVALALTVVCILGTHFWVPPFSSILNISQNIKDAAALKYGEPPFGHGQLEYALARSIVRNIQSGKSKSTVGPFRICIHSEAWQLVEYG